jgi:hypothetical protein
MKLKTKALFIYNDIYAKPIGGRKLFTKTNYEIINQLFKKRIINVKLQIKKKYLLLFKFFTRSVLTE